MITYEINIICDACKDECFTHEPIETPNVVEAVIEALNQGWMTTLTSNPDHRCPECVKNGVFPKQEVKGEQ